MHELSIAYNLVESVEATARKNSITHVDSVQIKLGALAGVVKEALLFAYEVASQDTLLQGSRLEIEDVPVVVSCPHCQTEQTLNNIQYLCCPVCHTPTPQLIQGREMEIISLTYHDESPFA